MNARLATIVTQSPLVVTLDGDASTTPIPLRIGAVPASGRGLVLIRETGGAAQLIWLGQVSGT